MIFLAVHTPQKRVQAKSYAMASRHLSLSPSKPERGRKVKRALFIISPLCIISVRLPCWHFCSQIYGPVRRQSLVGSLLISLAIFLLPWARLNSVPATAGGLEYTYLWMRHSISAAKIHLTGVALEFIRSAICDGFWFISQHINF